MPQESQIAREPRTNVLAAERTFSARPHRVIPFVADPSQIRIVERSFGERLRNRLIADLMFDRAGIESSLERVELGQKAVLCEPGESLRYVYFPETAVISFVTGCSRAAPIEVATVGREGMIGLPVFLEADSAPMRAVVKVRGIAERMSVDSFRSWTAMDATLHSRLLRYTGSFIAQLTQTATCNAVHLVEERCARWLLVTQDRTDGDELEVTHDFLASLLGVRRPGITTVMNSLKDQQLVSYSRGRVTVTNRPGLERVACGCYELMHTAETQAS